MNQSSETMTDNEMLVERTVIAKIVNPGAFVESYIARYPDLSTLEQYEAFQKADAILALRSQRDGKGELPEELPNECYKWMSRLGSGFSPPERVASGREIWNQIRAEFAKASPQPPTAPPPLQEFYSDGAKYDGPKILSVEPPPPAASEREAMEDWDFIRSALNTLSDPLLIQVTGTGTTRLLALVSTMRDIAKTASLRLPSPSGTEALVKALDMLDNARDYIANIDEPISNSEDILSDIDAALSEHRATAMPASNCGDPQ